MPSEARWKNLWYKTPWFYSTPQQTWSGFSPTTVPDNNRQSWFSPTTVPKLSTGTLCSMLPKLLSSAPCSLVIFASCSWLPVWFGPYSPGSLKPLKPLMGSHFVPPRSHFGSTFSVLFTLLRRKVLINEHFWVFLLGNPRGHHSYLEGSVMCMPAIIYFATLVWLPVSVGALDFEYARSPSQLNGNKFFVSGRT